MRETFFPLSVRFESHKSIIWTFKDVDSNHGWIVTKMGKNTLMIWVKSKDYDLNRITTFFQSNHMTRIMGAKYELYVLDSNHSLIQIKLWSLLLTQIIRVCLLTFMH